MILNFTSFSVSVNLTIGLVISITWLLLYPGCYAFCEYKWQQTPGKYLMKTVVIDEYANKPELRTIIVRSLIRLVPFEPFSCFGDNSRGWHDRWSHTWVVTEEEVSELRKLLTESTVEV
jgi:uncharacterized RDD family membrane protein YckC